MNAVAKASEEVAGKAALVWPKLGVGKGHLAQLPIALFKAEAGCGKPSGVAGAGGLEVRDQIV